MPSFTSYRWAHYSSRALAALPKQRIAAVLPVAAIEQHGPHLPLSTSTDILEGVIEATGRRLSGGAIPALFLPVLAVGESNKHVRYPGALNFFSLTILKVWAELTEGVAAAGDASRAAARTGAAVIARAAGRIVTRLGEASRFDLAQFDTPPAWS